VIAVAYPEGEFAAIAFETATVLLRHPAINPIVDGKTSSPHSGRQRCLFPPPISVKNIKIRNFQAEPH
jgi:hypothetical protein